MGAPGARYLTYRRIPAGWRRPPTVAPVANKKALPSSYGFYGLFLGTVSTVSGVIGNNTLFVGVGAASLVFGIVYLAVARQR